MPLLILFSLAAAYANLYEECAKLYNPNNYLPYLPNLHLPYLGNVPVPVNPPRVQPTPVITTKAVSVVTKYVYKNPVCVKHSKRQNACKQDNAVKHKADLDRLVTKEYFVKDREFDSERDQGHGGYGHHDEDQFRLQRNRDLEYYEDEDEGDYNDLTLTHFVQSSEEPRPFSKGNRHTPHLTKKHIHELLIEDRLDQLETILPHYIRRRTFETSTVTVTKVLSNKRSMATLIVKNCIPQGYELCSPKRKKRKSKVAQFSNNRNESHYYG